MALVPIIVLGLSMRYALCSPAVCLILLLYMKLPDPPLELVASAWWGFALASDRALTALS